METPTEPRIAELLNSLLECELSAIETYANAAKKLAQCRIVSELVRFGRDHEDAAEALRQQIRSLGGTPVESSGVWGKWPQGVEATSRVVGAVAELDALTGEETHSLYRYREVLGDRNLDPASRSLIQDRLLPRVSAHHERIAELLSEDD